MIGFMNTEQPLCSVIVPVYNAENYLAECIESVQTQGYMNYELLLVDDGSTDKSAIICDDYASKNPKIVVVHKVNAGVSSARNTGIDLSTGQYVMFLDADDYLVPGSLRVLIEAAEKFEADIVGGLTVDNSYLWKGDSDFIIWRGTEGIEQSLKDNPFTYAAWAKIYRKEVIGNTRFCEEFKINEDSLFVFEVLCKQPKFIGLKDEIYGYRNNVDSASHAKFSEKYFDVVKVAKKKYKIIKELYPAFLELAENMLLKADMNMLQIIAMRTHGEYKVQEKELLKEFRKKSKYYISAKKTDDKWFFVLKNHMYWIYKIVMGMR